MTFKRCCLVGFLCLAFLLSWTALAADGGQVLLVIPARYTAVQFAFNIAKLRSIYVAAYDTEGREGSLVMHVWDSEAREWVGTSLAEYQLGSA